MAKAGVPPSSIAVVGLTGYGNGLFLLDRHGKPTRNAVLSPDLRAQEIVADWRTTGLEDALLPLIQHRQWPGKPAPLIAWLAAREPETLARADHAMFCKDYLRFRLTGALGLEISELSSGGLADQAKRRFEPAILDRLGLGAYARLYGESVESLAMFGAVSEAAAAETGLVAGTPVSAGYADGPAMALGLGAVDDSLISVIAGTWGLNQLVSRRSTRRGRNVGVDCRGAAGRVRDHRSRADLGERVRMVRRLGRPARRLSPTRSRARCSSSATSWRRRREPTAGPIFCPISTAGSTRRRRAAPSSASPPGMGCQK